MVFGRRVTGVILRYMASSIKPVEANIFKKLSEFFKPVYIDVVNESYKHNVPEGSESHFKVSLTLGFLC